jgi:hypothetical protein
MLRANVSGVTLDFSDGNYKAGEITDGWGSPAGHGGLDRSSPKVVLPIHAHILGRPDLPNPNHDDPIAAIHSTPDALRKFCEDVLGQLDALEG